MSADISPENITPERRAEAKKASDAFLQSMGGGAAPVYRKSDSKQLDALILQKCYRMARSARRKYFKNMHKLLFPNVSWEDFNAQLREYAKSRTAEGI